jgi:hypothetical protein
MRQFSIFLLVSTLLCLAGIGCKKDTDVFIPLETTTSPKQNDTIWEDLNRFANIPISAVPPLNIEQLIDSLRSRPLIDSFSAELGGTIRSPDGSLVIEFPANICVGNNNQPLTGKLTVEVIVLRKKGDFIAHNLPTISGNRQLISGGALSILVKYRGIPVRINPSKTYKVRYTMPTIESQMSLWEGKFTGRFQFDWLPFNNNGIGTGGVRPSVETWRMQDSGFNRQGYVMVLDRFNWINCDKFGGDSTNFNSKFNVALPDTFTNINTAVFVAFKDLNSVLPLVGTPANRTFGILGRGLPVGRKVTVISISLIRERIYLGSSQEIEIAPTSNTQPSQPIRLIPQAMSIEALKDKLRAL